MNQKTTYLIALIACVLSIIGCDRSDKKTESKENAGIVSEGSEDLVESPKQPAPDPEVCKQIFKTSQNKIVAEHTKPWNSMMFSNPDRRLGKAMGNHRAAYGIVSEFWMEMNDWLVKRNPGDEGISLQLLVPVELDTVAMESGSDDDLYIYEEAPIILGGGVFGGNRDFCASGTSELYVTLEDGSRIDLPNDLGTNCNRANFQTHFGGDFSDDSYRNEALDIMANKRIINMKMKLSRGVTEVDLSRADGERIKLAVQCLQARTVYK